jgi:death-on-curing protein
MEREFTYPDSDEVAEFNQLALSIVRTTKADSHAILSVAKINSAIDECRNSPGNIYDKAAVLMRALTKAHAFASGNRRTAFLTSKYFVTVNGGKFKVPDNEENAVVMKELREGKHTDQQISEWIRNGKI